MILINKLLTKEYYRILGCDGNDPLWKCARNGYGRFSNSLPPAGSTPLSTLYQNTLRGRQSSSQHQSHYQQGYKFFYKYLAIYS